MLIMNTEYVRHEPVWDILKPKVGSQVEGGQSLPASRLSEQVPADSFEWHPAMLDATLLAHGHGELTSPLSEW
jgi:hypothetical protein